ncbi:MAG: hypothetical protein JNK76_03510 [Planctomycetales bacterium]|nr:hypothetical protein [Planctomycetales bacterium]
MTVVIDSTTSGAQGLFNRLGALGAILDQFDTLRGTTFPGLVESVLELYDGSGVDVRALPRAINPEALAAWRGGLGTNVLRSIAEATLIKAVDDDVSLPRRTFDYAWPELVKQLAAGGYYVAPNTVGASVTQTGLTGNGNVVVSTKTGAGVDMQTLLAETLRITVQSAGTAGSEQLRIEGEQAVADRLSHLWPAGSGASRAFTSLSPTSANNKITNGSFDTFTVTNTPDNWTLAAGTDVGVDVFEEGSTVFHAGGKALRLLHDGSTLLKLTSADLRSRLVAKQPYAVNLWCRNSTNPAAGVAQIDLWDGSSIINDEAGTANSFTINLTTLGTSYVPKSGVFRLPEPLPAAVYLRLHTTTAGSNTHSTYFDSLSLDAMQQARSGELGLTPWIKVFSGSTGWSLDDGAPEGSSVFKIVTTNNWAGAWLLLLERLFQLSEAGLFPPTSGSSEISESLIA